MAGSYARVVLEPAELPVFRGGIGIPNCVRQILWNSASIQGAAGAIHQTPDGPALEITLIAEKPECASQAD